MEDALGLLEQELSRESQESGGPVCRVDWDQSLVELTHSTRSSIPFVVVEAWSKAQQRADCGIWAQIHHAWACLDQTLYLWDYGQPNAVHTVPGDSAIISVGLGPAPSSLATKPHFVVVMATRLTVSLVGLTVGKNLQVVPLGLSTSTQGACFHAIRSTPNGRIFLLSGAPHVWEFCCTTTWLAKCRLQRHSLGLGRRGRLRVMASGPQGHLVLCDDQGTLRLCLAPETGLLELAALSAQQLEEQVRAVVSGRLASSTLTHLFSSLNSDGQLQLDASTAAGERLHFVCSVGDLPGRKFGFWLQRVSGVEHGAVPLQREKSCLEEHPEPCFASPGGGLWLNAAVHRMAATAADLAVSLRVDGLVDGPRAVEMQGVLNFDAPILDIAAEQLQSNCQRFAVLLTDRVEVIHVLHQASAAQRAPQSVAECCKYLCSLRSKAPGSSYEWLWSMDDVRFPSFEEQQRAQVLQLEVPCLILGRWPRALLRFLASKEITQTLLVEAYARDVVSMLGCKRRRCSAPVLAMSEARAKSLAEELKPVIRFVREGLSVEAEVAVPTSAAERSQLYVKCREGAADPAKQRVTRAMRQLVCLMEHLQQHLAFTEILHKSGCVQEVLKSSLLLESAGEGHSSALSLLLSTKLKDLAVQIWPVVQLCNALIMEVVRKEALQGPSADTVCRELQERCPTIFSEIDVPRCTKDASGPAVISVLQRYAGALPAEAVQGLRGLAHEDAKKACELCAEKIFALREGDVQAHARDLLTALLDAMRLEQVNELTQVVDAFLQRLRPWRGGAQEAVLHHMVLDHMLSTPRLHGLLETMVSTTNSAAWAEMLQQRAEKSRVAAELLWRYYQQRGQVRPEWAQLQRLVEAPQFYSLRDRIRYLRLAQERKSGTAGEEFSMRLNSAEKLQLPLLNELQELVRAEPERHQAAKKHCHELHQLQGVKELYEVAEQFGFWHLQLAIAGFSGVNMAHHVATTLWIGVLFPSDCVYSGQASSCPKQLFPLLMLRPHREFFLREQGLSLRAPVEPNLLAQRVLCFLKELREVAPENQHLWHARCVGTLLEFSNCLWLMNVPPRPEGDASAGSPVISETCLWVAREVLACAPFHLDVAERVHFYAEMISKLHIWQKDLQETLPAKLRSKSLKWPTEEDVHLHLSQVALVVLADWLREAERRGSHEKEKAEQHFAQVWRRSAEGLLAGLCLRLNGSKQESAQRLLVEALRLEKSCRLLLERVHLVSER